MEEILKERPKIRVQRLDLFYGDFRALKEVSLEVPRVADDVFPEAVLPNGTLAVRSPVRRNFPLAAAGA